MHKTIRLTTAGAAIAAAFAFSTAASAATTATGNANAEILETLIVEEMVELDFGQIAVNGAGTVVVDSSATPTDLCTGGLICAGTKARGVFRVTGTGDVQIVAQVLEASVPLTGPGPDMTLDTFTLGWPNGNTLDATTGQRSFQVGGTLHVAAGQTAGLYTGQYTVSVEYN
jgi:hypothetical protein